MLRLSVLFDPRLWIGGLICSLLSAVPLWMVARTMAERERDLSRMTPEERAAVERRTVERVGEMVGVEVVTGPDGLPAIEPKRPETTEIARIGPRREDASMPLPAWAAAGGVGLLVLAVGGVGAVLLARRPEEPPADDQG